MLHKAPERERKKIEQRDDLVHLNLVLVLYALDSLNKITYYMLCAHTTAYVVNLNNIQNTGNKNFVLN